MSKQTKWKFESSPRWIRVEFNGEIVADSKNVMLMIESGYELVYYFPVADVRNEFLTESDHSTRSGYRGDGRYWHVNVGDKTAENAAFTFDSPEGRPDLSGYIAFDWHAMDTWYEEEEVALLHPRNPYHRVDTLPSSRHIKVVVDGVTIAETDRPYLLFETSLPTRYYIPQDDVNMEYLVKTDTHTICPYKGEADYWSIQIGDTVHQDVVWGYLDPIPEIPKIKGLMAFYNEKLDIYVDGELESRPRTIFS